KSWQQCDAAIVRSFAVRSRRKGLGPASLALRLSALRSFFDWLLCAIPCGETVSYQQLAATIGKPTAVRAVASACGANKLAMVIP
ncbi:methylated-DNA--[protein]-cysteine S-methyltransferase, partial [Salmonella enterica subsp. enterica serovar Cerro]|nr:methylated-DNA--[protein]-cysteine S-methyltransferase [Salmonella enterica subsp. enterica serovar Cerro]